MELKTISALYRAQDANGTWRYGYIVDQWIYGAGLEPFRVNIQTLGKAIDVNDKTGTPIYEGDTFEYKGHKFVVSYDAEDAQFVGKCIDNPTYQIWGADLKHMVITGNIHE